MLLIEDIDVANASMEALIGPDNAVIAVIRPPRSTLPLLRSCMLSLNFISPSFEAFSLCDISTHLQKFRGLLTASS